MLQRANLVLLDGLAVLLKRLIALALFRPPNWWIQGVISEHQIPLVLLPSLEAILGMVFLLIILEGGLHPQETLLTAHIVCDELEGLLGNLIETWSRWIICKKSGPHFRTGSIWDTVWSELAFETKRWSMVSLDNCWKIAWNKRLIVRLSALLSNLASECGSFTVLGNRLLDTLIRRQFHL